jgi:hypothetical protein
MSWYQVLHRNISSKFAYFSGMDVLRHWDRRIEKAVLRIIKNQQAILSGGQNQSWRDKQFTVSLKTIDGERHFTRLRKKSTIGGLLEIPAGGGGGDGFEEPEIVFPAGIPHLTE